MGGGGGQSSGGGKRSQERATSSTPSTQNSGWSPIEQQAKANKEAFNTTTNANRPDINTSYGNEKWTQNKTTGEWTLDKGLNGPLGQANDSLQSQYAEMMKNPMEVREAQLRETGPMDEAMSGDAARQAAFKSAYTQSTSRLDPQWKRREEAMDTKLLNQGLTPGTEAYKNAMSEMGMQRNDAYQGAINSAIGASDSAGNSVFQNNLAGNQAKFGSELARNQAGFGQEMARNQSLFQDMLTARNNPLQQMQGMNSLNQTPQYNAAGQLQAPDWLTAQRDTNNANLAFSKQDTDTGFQLADLISGMAGGGASGLMSKSDLRFKKRIHREEAEALPGVPFATWEYKDAPGVRVRGVIAQDLEKVSPQHVARDARGMRWVDYSFLGGR